MDELLTEVKTGETKGTSSDAAGVRYGVWRKWSRPQDKHKGEREAMLHVFGEIAKENRLVKVMTSHWREIKSPQCWFMANRMKREGITFVDGCHG